MAVISTATTDNGVLTTWDSLGGGGRPILGVEAIPFGEVIFSGTATIPLLLAANTGEWTLQCNFPRNFVYRLIDHRIVVAGDTAADFADAESAMAVSVISDKAGVSSVVSYRYELKGDTYAITGPDVEESFFFTGTPGSTDRLRFFQPPYLPGELIDASDAARLFGRWANRHVAGDTAAFSATWRIRAHAFTVEQLRTFPVHTSTPISGS